MSTAAQNDADGHDSIDPVLVSENAGSTFFGADHRVAAVAGAVAIDQKATRTTSALAARRFAGGSGFWIRMPVATFLVRRRASAVSCKESSYFAQFVPPPRAAVRV